MDSDRRGTVLGQSRSPRRRMLAVARVPQRHGLRPVPLQRPSQTRPPVQLRTDHRTNPARPSDRPPMPQPGLRQSAPHGARDQRREHPTRTLPDIPAGAQDTLPIGSSVQRREHVQPSTRLPRMPHMRTATQPEHLLQDEGDRVSFGYVVAPPSINENGIEYRWAIPIDLPAS